MKRSTKLLLLTSLVTASALFVTACGSKETGSTQAPAAAEAATETATEAETEAKTEAAAVTTGHYSVYNVTGEKVTELYLYETGSDRGENLVPEGLRNNKELDLTYDGTEETALTLEFVTESGTTNKFETLHIEDVPVALLAADAMTGATPISFGVPEDTGNYKLVNTTGTDITELYVYPADSSDKGENLAEGGMADGESTEFSYTGDVTTALVVEFTTEADGTKKFETLHIENVTLNLLSADAMTGATPVEFAAEE